MNTLGDALERYFKKIENNQEDYFKTGFALIDGMFESNMNGKLIILAARPAMGKSSFALDISLNISKKRKGSVYFFSTTESETNLAGRILAKEARIKFRILKSDLSNDEILKLKTASENIANLPFYLFTKGLFTTYQIHEEVSYSSDEKNSLIIIDELDRIGCQEIGSRSTALHDVLEELKMIAVESKCPILVLCDLTRTLENRFIKRPRIDDLPFKDVLLEHADTIVTLYRDDFYDNNSDEPNIAEFIFLKNTEGETGFAKLFWNKELSSFEKLI